MDRVYEAAVERLDELRQELKKLEEFVATYRQLAVELHIESMNETRTLVRATDGVSPVDKASEDRAKEANALESTSPKRVRVSDNPKPADVVTAAANVIRNAGLPLSRREIWESLKAAGMEVRGADPIKALGTMLWRSGRDQLVQIEGRGYWLKDEPYEAAGYHPASSLFS